MNAISSKSTVLWYKAGFRKLLKYNALHFFSHVHTRSVAFNIRVQEICFHCGTLYMFILLLLSMSPIIAKDAKVGWKNILRGFNPRSYGRTALLNVLNWIKGLCIFSVSSFTIFLSLSSFFFASSNNVNKWSFSCTRRLIFDPLVAKVK